MAAIDLNSGLLVDVIALEAGGDKLTVTRPIYGGKVLAKVTCSLKPADHHPARARLSQTRLRSPANPGR